MPLPENQTADIYALDLDVWRHGWRHGDMETSSPTTKLPQAAPFDAYHCRFFFFLLLSRLLLDQFLSLIYRNITLILPEHPSTGTPFYRNTLLPEHHTHSTTSSGLSSHT